MQDLEAREQSIIQHIRTAGLQKRREVTIIDEILELRKERRKCFASLISENENVKGKIVEQEEKFNKLLSAYRDDISGAVTKVEDRFKSAHEELSQKYQSLREENKQLIEENASLKSLQDKLLTKSNEKVRILGEKLRELAELQARTQTSLKRELEENLTARISGELSSKHEFEILKLKESLRSVADREVELKALTKEQKSVIHSYQADNDELKSKIRQLEDVLMRVKSDVFESKLSNEKQALKIQSLENVLLNKDLEIEAIKKKCAAEVAELRKIHESELGQISAKVKATVVSKDQQIAELNRRVQQLSADRDQLTAAFHDISSGLSR